MKRTQFIVFLTSVLTVYSLVCLYVFLDYRSVVNSMGVGSLWFTILYILLCSLFIAGRFLERIYPQHIIFYMVRTGAWWLGALIYLFLFLAITDIIFLVFKVLHAPLLFNHSALIIHTRLVILGSTLIILVAGYLNAIKPRKRKITINTSRLPAGSRPFRIFAVTDVHLGSIRGKRSLQRLVEMINKSNSDIVVFGGDTLDEDVAPVISQNLGDCLRQIRAVHGAIGIPGNHEYIGGIGAAIPYLREHGIRMLLDESVTFDDHFVVIGRQDRDMKRFTGKERLPLKALLQDKDRDKFIILLDHQPFVLSEAAEQGVDLQISGHTHDGQMWPFNLITKRIYEKSAGVLKNGDTRYIISSGYGTWGPPIRIGTHPEVWEITIVPESQ